MKRFFTYLLSGSAYIAGIGLTISSAWLITTASFQPPLQALSIAIVGVRFFGISRSVARYSERVVSHTTVFNQLTGVRVKLFQGISANPLELIRDSGAGRLVKRLVDDVERAQEYELRVTMPHAAATISLATGVALGGWIQPVSLIITVPVAFLLLFVIPRLIKSHSQGIASSIENLESSYATQIQEATHGLIEAKLYGYLDQRLARISTLEMQALEEERKLNTSNRTFQGVLLVAIGFTLFALTEMALHFSRHIPPVQVTILIFLPLVAFEATLALYPNLFSAGKMVLARQEIAAIQSSKQSEVKPLHMLNEKVTQFDVQSVQVQWGNESAVFRPLNFSLRSGESIAIRGRSGVGKSTFALGLLGLLSYKGEIFLNGVELRGVANPTEYIVGTIQNSHVFNTSVRENLRIASPEATDEEIVKVLSLVELDSLISHMDEGLDTHLGEMGRQLSGGEAKRLSLARVLLSPSGILILDEPTEHLDIALAKRIEDRVLGLGRTIIVITHSGWEKCDQTMSME